MAVWYLSNCTGADLTPEVIPVESFPFVIGRSPDSSLCLSTSRASKAHAELLLNDGQLHVRDRGSRNGTFVNQRRIAGVEPLNAGDFLSIADHVFCVIRESPTVAQSNENITQQKPNGNTAHAGSESGWVGHLAGHVAGLFMAEADSKHIAKSVNRWIRDTFFSADSNDEQQVIQLVAGLLKTVAGIDGQIHERERQLIQSICFDLARDMQVACEASTIQQVLDNSDDLDRVMQFVQAAHGNPEWGASILRACYRVASADLMITDSEAEFLLNIGKALGVDDDARLLTALVFQRHDMSGDACTRAREVLGVAADVPLREIKARYFALSQAYHPDAHKDLPKQLVELTSKKFSEIADAYRTLTEAPQLYGLELATSVVTSAKSGEVVRCFVCKQKCRLPDEQHHPAVRCPKCQALLLQPLEFATALVATNAGDG